MRRRRLVLRMVAALVVVVCCVIAAGLFWPGPSDVPRMRCGAGDGAACVEASGRLVYVESAAPEAMIHAVLLSRRSLTMPGLVAIKLPSLRAKPAGLRLGRWVSVAGADIIGSHGEHDLHVVRMAIGSMELRCEWGASPRDCRSRRP